MKKLKKYGEYLKSIKPPNVYADDLRIKLLTYQFYSGGSSYLESGAVPTQGHIYCWTEAYSFSDEATHKEHFLRFMRNELSRFPEFKQDLPKIENVIRFIYGHKTDIKHPAMNSIRKSYRKLGIDYAEQGVPYATDAFAFKKVSKTDVVVLGPTGETPMALMNMWILRVC
jgi:hypothetical protein